jgi:hypothetical protein
MSKQLNKTVSAEMEKHMRKWQNERCGIQESQNFTLYRSSIQARECLGTDYHRGSITKNTIRIGIQRIRRQWQAFLKEKTT